MYDCRQLQSCSVASDRLRSLILCVIPFGVVWQLPWRKLFPVRSRQTGYQLCTVHRPRWNLHDLRELRKQFFSWSCCISSHLLGLAGQLLLQNLARSFLMRSVKGLPGHLRHFYVSVCECARTGRIRLALRFLRLFLRSEITTILSRPVI